MPRTPTKKERKQAYVSIDSLTEQFIRALLGGDGMIEHFYQKLHIGQLYIVLPIVGLLLVFFCVIKGHTSKKIFFITLVLMVMLFVFNIYFNLIPCLKDYEYIRSGDIPEEEMVMVQYTYVYYDQQHMEKEYSKPEFYIESKDEYIVLHLKNVEVGKKYRIRYLPNTKISEIVECIE